MDAPVWYHAPKLVLWCLFEALALTLAIWVTREFSHDVRRLCCCQLGLQYPCLILSTVVLVSVACERTLHLLMSSVLQIGCVAAQAFLQISVFLIWHSMLRVHLGAELKTSKQMSTQQSLFDIKLLVVCIHGVHPSSCSRVSWRHVVAMQAFALQMTKRVLLDDMPLWLTQAVQSGLKTATCRLSLWC